MNVLEIARARVDQLRTRAVVVPDQPGIFSVEGPGASDCLQGLFTNDVVKPGPDSLSYGAFLTPKGAIITDAWLLRTEGPWLIVVDAVGRQPTADLLRRQLPPRLARVTDRSAELAVLWLLGARRRNGLGPLGTLGDPPAPGRLLTIEGDGGSRVVATGPRSAPFAVLVVVPSAVQEAAAADLVAAGAIRGDLVDLRIARVVAGVPTLGEEIDDRTFPQEADFDRLEGVSYSKGCYVGQETVARIHFRGHPNWLLRGLRGKAGWEPVAQATADGKTIARMGTLLRFEDGEVVGLAVVRRELAPGSNLSEDGLVRVEELPLASP